jgi:hypothetical protein
VCNGALDFVPARGSSPQLTARQYNNTVRSLFPQLNVPAQEFPPATGATFDNDASALVASPSLVERQQRAAQNVAQLAAAQLGQALPCRPASAAEEPTCGRTFVTTFLERAWRRPPAADELASTIAFFESMRGKYGFTMAAQLAIEAILQTPDFLYLVRPAGTATNGQVPLTNYEVASRLSYFVWEDMPDDSLYRAAKDGTLAQPAVLEAQARRLLADPRAHATVANFHRQWLRLDKLDALDKNRTSFPRFDPARTPAALRVSLEKFVDYVFWGAGTVSALLTDNTAFVDDNLIPVYGLTMPATGQWQTVKLDSKSRGGLLTQAGLLAELARSTTESPTLRGAFLMDKLLCMPVPAPPAGVSTVLPAAPAGQARTLRERLEQTHTQPTCAACHRAIDGLGYGFQAYDALGQFRTTEAGRPVDARGEIVGTRDADGPFNGALELSQRLAGSQQVRQCVATHWMRYALAGATNGAEACAANALGQTLGGVGGNMRELLVGIVKSAAFRFTRPEAM